MDSIQPGRYRIQLVAEPKPFVGQNSDSPFKEQIVTNGKYNVWAVQPSPDGKRYQLILTKPAALFSKGDDDSVVGDVDPPATMWDIYKWGEGYVIQKPGDAVPSMAWTVGNPSEPTCPVTFDGVVRYPQDSQLWNFYLIDEE